MSIEVERLESLFLDSLRFLLAGPLQLRTGGAPEAMWCRRLTTVAAVHGLVGSEKVVTKRDLYYLHKTLFGTQRRADACVEWLSKTMEVPRSALRVVAAARGLVVGELLWREGGQQVRVARFGRAGHLIPASLSMSVTEVDARGVKAVVYVEKEAVFHQVAASGIHERYPVAVVTAKGFADLGTRELLAVLSRDKGLPILGIVDADPYGASILCTLLGSQKRRDPALVSCGVEWIGVRPSMLAGMRERKELDEAHVVKMSAADHCRCKSVLQRTDLPEDWREEMEILQKMDRKAEIEILDAISPNYVSDVLLTNAFAQRGIIPQSS